MSISKICKIAMVGLATVTMLSAQVDLNVAMSEGLRAYSSRDYAKAIENLSAIVSGVKEKSPESVLYCLAFAYYNQLRYEDAVNTFQLHAQGYPAVKNAAEVQLFLGKSLLNIEGREGDALKALAAAAKNPELKEEARLAAADAYIKKDDSAKAAEILQTAIREKVSGPGMMRACLQLVDLYIAADQLDKSYELLKQVQGTPNLPDVIVAVNHRFVQIGDKQLESKNYHDALTSYSAVRPHAQVLSIQEERLNQLVNNRDALKKKLDADYKAKKLVSRSQEGLLETMNATAEHLTKVLDEVKGLTEYDAVLRYRIARCYFNMDRYWVASSAFESIIADYPAFSDTPTAIFGAIVCEMRLGLNEGALKLCSQYLEKYKDGKYVDQIADIKSSLLLKDNKLKETIEFVTSFLAENKKSTNIEKFSSLIANARFSNGQYDEAASDYDNLLKNHSGSAMEEEYIYRRALCDFLRNDYDNTIKSFDNYDKKYPSGLFSADIQYRRGIILMAQAAQTKDPEKQVQRYKELHESMDKLVADQNTKDFRGQIYTLIADAYAAQGENDLAATNYALAVKHANGDQSVLQYALEEATNALKGNRRWTELMQLWETFLKDNPGHQMELRGVSELCKLYIREKKPDEAKKTMLKYIMNDVHNPRSEYVEMLISQYAALFVPKKTYGKPKEGEAPQPSTEEILKQIADSFQLPEDNRSLPYLARMQFVRSEFGRMTKNEQLYKSAIHTIAITYKAEDLSPTLLALVGQSLYDAKQYDEAKPFFTRLKTSFAESYYSEAGPIGLGLIALDQKNYPDALAEFTESLAKPTGGMIKEATFGKARALFYLKKYPEAKELFKEIIGTKEWRGEEKAGAIFYMGEVSDKEGDSGAAHSYFQRVYLSHAAYPAYAAKAYIRAAELLRSQGKSDEAKATLRELIAHPKLKDTDDAKQAAKML